MLAGLAAKARALLAVVAASALTPIVLLLVLQLKMVLVDAETRDITSGDTSGYFLAAVRWPAEHVVNIVWSPLYTMYYGWFLSLTPDVYAATVLHRWAIFVASGMLLLLLLRILLPVPLAW